MTLKEVASSAQVHLPRQEARHVFTKKWHKERQGIIEKTPFLPTFTYQQLSEQKNFRKITDLNTSNRSQKSIKQ